MRGDRPCQSPGRGRLSADERLQVEGLLEHVVYRLEGKGSDRFVSFSSMLRHGVTMETVTAALMLRRGGKARVYFEDAVSMLGQIARRINSYLLPRIVALRLDLDRQCGRRGSPGRSRLRDLCMDDVRQKRCAAKM